MPRRTTDDEVVVSDVAQAAERMLDASTHGCAEDRWRSQQDLRDHADTLVEQLLDEIYRLRKDTHR
ncbi:hypothetical protein [Actinomyces howellii]|uniref:hypothetical protein n=1 Tax=Actinomyces howellii TaxID=52771 RepID=UPI0013750311|nr:hypothetical protein [Actinomyces howellii]